MVVSVKQLKDKSRMENITPPLIMNTLTCVEKINPDRIQELLDHPNIAKEYKTSLRKLKKVLKKDGSHKVTFAMSKEAGRLYPDDCPSVQGIERNIRKFLMCERYTDIDMVNAHPVILSQRFKKENRECPVLDMYINNREPMLKEMINTIDKTLSNLNDNNSKYKKIKKFYANYTSEDKRDLAKVQFIRIMYGGTSASMSFSVWKGSNEEKNYITWEATEFLKLFEKEFRQNADYILKLPENQVYVEMARNSDKGEERHNPLGTGLSYLAQDLERKIVLTARATFEKNEYVPSTIIHDGFLVECLPDDLPDDILRQAENAVKDAHEYDIRLEKKKLTDYDTDKLFGDTQINEEIDDDGSHTDFAIAFLQEMEDLGHAFVRGDGETYWFRPATEDKYGVYELMEKEVWEELRIYMNTSTVLPNSKRGMTKFQNDMKTQLSGLIPREPLWSDKIIDTINRKIPFKNGVYCLVQKKLVSYNPSMYFLERGAINYKEVDQRLKDEVYKKVFLDVFHEPVKAEYVLKLISRTIAGEWSDRIFPIICGLASSGKGSLCELLRRAFPTLVGSYDAGVLCGSTCKGDIAKENSWKVDKRHKRLLFANEKPTSRIHGEKIKQASSGGDSQTARANYGKKNLDIRTTFNLYNFFNEMVQCTDLKDAVKKKIKIITTYAEFLEPDEIEERKKKFNGILPAHIKPADPTIKTNFLMREDVHQAFAQLVLEHYRTEAPVAPDMVKEETADYLFDDNDDDKIETLYVVTDREDDKLYVSELQKRGREKFIYMTMTDLRKKVEAKTGKTWKRTTHKNAKDYFMTHMKICPKDDEEYLNPYMAVNTYPHREYTVGDITVDDP
jgi:hypothetical protein